MWHFILAIRFIFGKIRPYAGNWRTGVSRLDGAGPKAGTDASKPRVFVSHSAKGTIAQEVLGALGDALRDAGFDPFIDTERLRLGDRWRSTLRTEALHCQAGVILLCRNALASEWVLQEGTILLTRWEDGGFMLVPVRLDGVSVDDIRGSLLRQLALPDDVQMASPATVQETVQAIVASLAPTIEQSALRRPLFDLENDVAARLRGVSEAALRKIAAVVGVDHTRWHPEGLVEAVARRMFDEEVTLDELAAALRPLGTRGRDWVGLVDTVIPFKTIPKDAAASLGPMVAVGEPDASAARPHPAALARAARERTGDWYLRRAACRIPAPDPVKLTSPAQPGSFDTDVSANVAVEILAQLGFLPDEEPSDEELERAFDDHERRLGPVTAVLSWECDSQLVRQLRSEHRRVVFLVLTRSAEPERLDLGDVEILRPLIDAEQERTFHRRYYEMTGTKTK